MSPAHNDLVGALRTTAAPTRSGTAMRLSGVDKSFGAVKVLKEASIDVRPGTVHALLGGNGSGKSTAVKILAGVYQADAGHLEVFGEQYDLKEHTPATAQRAGLRFVHQDLGLFDDLTIEENFALDAGYPRNGVGGVNWKALRTRVDQLIDEYHIHGAARTPVNRLRPADRTLLAIARALQDDSSGKRVVVLDEPTATLGKKESDDLLARVRRLADLGQTFVIVSHRLQEILEVAQDFTILRDGEVAGGFIDSLPSEDDIVRVMAGGTLVASLRPTGSISHAVAEPMLTFTDVRTGPLQGVDLTVHRGEIVGLAGLAGSGRSTLLSLAFGVCPADSGSMTVEGVRYAPQTIADAMSRGVALVPENRARDASFPDLSTNQNLSMNVLRRMWSKGLISSRRTRQNAMHLIARFGVTVAGPDALFSSMSGGNQQKIVMARWLQRDPRVLLLDEPTQGVDVMSRADIYNVIRDAAITGSCVLIASSDLNELHALCDRIVILAGGRITHHVAAADLSVDALTALVLKQPTAGDHAS